MSNEVAVWTPVINTIDFPSEMHRFDGMSECEMNRLATVGVRDGAQMELVMKHDHDRLVAELKAQLAKQAKVIARLKKDISDFIIYVDSDADSFGDRYWQTRNTLIAMLKETTAIERGEG